VKKIFKKEQNTHTPKLKNRVKFNPFIAAFAVFVIGEPTVGYGTLEELPSMRML
jgi:hypothetical protein